MSYRLDSSVIKPLTDKVSKTEKAISKARFRTVNRVTNSMRSEASKEIRKQVNLPAAYVNQNLKVTRKATEQEPVAIISGRILPTRLARYGAKQLTRSSGGSLGDSLRGISAGRRQAGVSVMVQRGRRRKMRKAFMVPLRNASVMGVFIRTGRGKGDIKHLYGPSVDQVFNNVRKDLQPTIRRKLVKEFKAQFRFASGGGR